MTMTGEQINLASLYRQYYKPRNVQRAVAILKKFPTEATHSKLAHLLRNHEDEPVKTRLEVELRDSFDFLLSYYSLLEIAAQIDFIPLPVPTNLATMARRHLYQPDLRRYYEQHYPLLLPQLFRLRLADEVQVHEAGNTPTGRQSGDLFLQFLTLLSTRMNDPDIDIFLFMLDDGIEQHYDWSHALTCLKSAKTYFRTLSKKGREDALQQALRGFPKFLIYCEALYTLLRDCEGLPKLQSAIWHYNSYWFSHLKEKMGRRLPIAMEHIMTWQRESQAPQQFEIETKKVMERIMYAVDHLMAGHYKSALLQADPLIKSLAS